MRNLPKTVNGQGKLGDAINSIIAYLATLRPLQSSDSLLEHSSMGVIRRPRVTVGGGAQQTASKGLVFRGVWSPAESYGDQDLVFRTPPGGSAGAYIGAQDGIPIGTIPESGTPWWYSWPTPPAGMWG